MTVHTPPPEGGRIVDEPMSEALSRRYLAYALSTITNRALPDVRERVDLYFQHEPRAVDQLLSATTEHGNVVVVDLREQDPIWATNRFMVYALYPQCNLSIHRMWGLKKQNTVFAIGKSIFERTCATDVGELQHIIVKKTGGGSSPERIQRFRSSGSQGPAQASKFLNSDCESFWKFPKLRYRVAGIFLD